ncbi:MAG: hypothetical protein M3Q10_17260, partial [Chloroflexota bacterium]|nr:hypothetical protein [Chloroflexota bacterium]
MRRATGRTDLGHHGLAVVVRVCLLVYLSPPGVAGGAGGADALTRPVRIDNTSHAGGTEANRLGFLFARTPGSAILGTRHSTPGTRKEPATMLVTLAADAPVSTAPALLAAAAAAGL